MAPKVLSDFSLGAVSMRDVEVVKPTKQIKAKAAAPVRKEVQAHASREKYPAHRIAPPSRIFTKGIAQIAIPIPENRSRDCIERIHVSDVTPERYSPNAKRHSEFKGRLSGIRSQVSSAVRVRSIGVVWITRRIIRSKLASKRRSPRATSRT
jgi:hypothetical protein